MPLAVRRIPAAFTGAGSAELAVGRPADDFLARHYREHRELAGATAVFSGMILYGTAGAWLPEFFRQRPG